MTAKVDPKLVAALKQAGKTKRPVEAYVVIRALAAGSGETHATRILSRVARKTHTKVIQSQYLDLLDSIHVSAPATFVLELIQQPEVLAADPPPSVRGSAMIKPRNPRRVTAEEIDVPIRRGEPA